MQSGHLSLVHNTDTITFVLLWIRQTLDGLKCRTGFTAQKLKLSFASKEDVE